MKHESILDSSQKITEIKCSNGSHYNATDRRSCLTEHGAYVQFESGSWRFVPIRQIQWVSFENVPLTPPPADPEGSMSNFKPGCGDNATNQMKIDWLEDQENDEERVHVANLLGRDST